ncbi:hypothetical protein PV328_001802 [Microctonus aethiopoides]|uniref:Regulator of microtubule dynamics protein 1 n=1 Tax=Microctonus aethiopoides TaxID=144406 RepID=A0AA39KXZ1_9HYME|nr:hypothetical protein PV328_001802 [Microctonus aethiopoides]
MSQLHNSQILAVALGATIGVIGAASLFIYQKIMEHKEREQMMDNLESVNRRVSELQIALDNMTAQQEQQRAKRSKTIRKRVASTNSYYSSAATDNEIDAISVAETDIDDEFYDCSDDENVPQMDTEPTVMFELQHQLAVLDKKIEKEELYEEVLCDLRSLATWHGTNVEVIWRLARACWKNAKNLTDKKRQDVLLQEGIQFCENLLDKEHVDLHKWYAMLVGLTTENLPIKDKLAAGKRFEKHVKLALRLRPTDSTLNHLLGRFQYTVSGLTWIEKKICETLFGEAPTSTYVEAIANLEKAEEYATEPDIENKYFLAQSYLKIKSYQKSVDLFKQLVDLPPRNKNHEDLQLEAKNLITTHSGYC